MGKPKTQEAQPKLSLLGKAVAFQARFNPRFSPRLAGLRRPCEDSTIALAYGGVKHNRQQLLQNMQQLRAPGRSRTGVHGFAVRCLASWRRARRAAGENRTRDLRITDALHFHCATAAGGPCARASLYEAGVWALDSRGPRRFRHQDLHLDNCLQMAASCCWTMPELRLIHAFVPHPYRKPPPLYDVPNWPILLPRSGGEGSCILIPGLQGQCLPVGRRPPTVDSRGFGPLLSACDAEVLPLTLRARGGTREG